MDDELQGPPKPQAPQNIELTLAQQANAAIKAGRDPAAVTKMLGRVVQHVRANPEIGKQAAEAVAAGRDPAAITGMLAEQAMPDPMAKYHQMFAGGSLRAHEQAANATDPEVVEGREADPMGEVARSVGAGAATTASGLPGGKLAVSAIRSGLTGDPLADSERAVNESVSDYRLEHPRSALALEMLGSTPLMGPMAKLGGAVGGAAYAGAQRLLDTNPDETLGERLKGTGLSALGGAVVGTVAPSLMRNPITRTAGGAVIGGMLAPKGLAPTLAGAVAGGTLAASPSTTAKLVGHGASTLAEGASKIGADKVAGALDKTGSFFDALSQSSGLPGKINREMEGADRLVKPLGGNLGEAGTASPKAIDAAKTFYSKANQLYDRARTDNRLLNDPDVMNLVNDPHLKSFWNKTVEIRQAQGVPVPGELIPTSRVSVFGVPAPAATYPGAGMTYRDVPDPEALHLMKRLVRDVVDRGYDKGSTISLADAKILEPKLNALTDVLHTRSRDYALADRFFNSGMTAEEGFARGYGAAKPGARNPTASNLTENTPSGALDWARNQKTGRNKIIAEAAARRGARGQLLQQVQGQDLRGGREGMLNLPGLAPSGNAAEQRALALGPTAPDYEQTVSDVASETAKDQPFFRNVMMHLRGLPGAGARALAPTGPLSTPLGEQMVRKIPQDPAAFQRLLAQYGRGKDAQALMQAWAGLQGANAVGRR